MDRLLRAVESGCAAFGRAAAWAVPLLVLSVCVSVLLSQLRWNVLLDWSAWGPALPMLGQRLSAAALNDLQWHLFAVMTMLGGVYALHENSHVSVDFLAARFSPRTKRVVTLLGDLLLLLPFSVVMAWFSWHYMMSAYTSGEGSPDGGLDNRWIIKAVMPLGFGLLVLFGTARVLRTASELLSGDRSRT